MTKYIIDSDQGAELYDAHEVILAENYMIVSDEQGHDLLMSKKQAQELADIIKKWKQQ